MQTHMLRSLIFAMAIGQAGCATLPTMMHNPTAGGVAIEAGPLYGTGGTSDADDVTSDTKDKLKTQDGAGFAGLAQMGPFYAKFDAAPLPGMWLGLGMIDQKPGKFGWYPAIEFTGASRTGDDETKDGYLTDDDGNRYLYEVKRTHSGFGIALPQLVEVYPVKRFGIFGGAVPTFLNNNSKTEVEMVYERDNRLVKADPDLDAKFQDIVTYEQRNDKNINRWSLPLTLGVRFQIQSFHARLAFVTRRVDSTKNYENTFRDVALLTVGYVSASSASSAARSTRTPPKSSTPAPSSSPATTTTTTTTNPDGSTTTTTTTKPAR